MGKVKGTMSARLFSPSGHEVPDYDGKHAEFSAMYREAGSGQVRVVKPGEKI
jgi:hypothetical protein